MSRSDFTPRSDWQNKPSRATPLKAEDLLRYEAGIDASAAVADVGTPGTATGDALRAALVPQAVVGTVAAVTAGNTTSGVQTANAAALAAACTAAIAAGHNTVLLPTGNISWSSTLHLASPIRFRGSALGPKPDGFVTTNLCFTGTGPAIDIGSDNGQAPDTSPAYDGPEGTELDGVSLSYTGTSTTALANGQGTYGTGTIGIRDWRGGRLNLHRAYIDGFETGFWGQLSDENPWDEFKFKRCHTGAYIGTRSDQLVVTGGEFYRCDRAVDIDGAESVTFIRTSFVDCGSGSTCAVRVDSTTTRPSVGVVFHGPHFESLNGASSDAFVEVGTSGTTQSTDVLLLQPFINTHASGGGARAASLVRVGNGTRVIVDTPHGPSNSLDQLIECVGTTSPVLGIIGPESTTFSVLNSGTGTPVINRTIRQTGGGFRVTAPFTLVQKNSTAGLRRFGFDLANAEVGSNAGSDLQLQTYDDAGALNATLFTISRGSGTFNMGNSVNFAFGTGSGTKLGTSATQKLAFYGATPIVRQATPASPGTDGTTLKQAVDAIRTILVNYGLTS